MKILHTVERYWPDVGGAQEVVRQVSERLARRGHQVTVATSKMPERNAARHNGVTLAEFNIRGNLVTGLQGEVERYRRFLLDGDYDLVLNYAAQQWATDAALAVLDRLRYKRVLAPCGFSGLFTPAYSDYFRLLASVLPAYDRVVLHSDTYRDAVFVRSHGTGKTSLIPNGCGEDEFLDPDRGFRRRRGIPEDVPMLLTVGSHTGLKGHVETMGAFLRAHTGKAVLVVVGNTPSSGGCARRCRRVARLARCLTLGIKRILVLDLPRAEAVAALSAADLFVLASRIECSPLVLFESAASGTAFVSLDVGNAREIAQWTSAGIVVDCAYDRQGLAVAPVARLARAITELLRDRPRREALGEKGRQTWLERFSWEKITLEYERVYREVFAA